MEQNPLALLTTTDLEDSLIGYTLTQTSLDRVIECVEILTPLHYSHPQNQEIWALIKDLVMKGKSTDVGSVSLHYDITKLADKVSKTKIFGLEQAKDAATLIRDFALKRELYSLLHEAQTALIKPTLSADEFIAKLDAKILAKSTHSTSLESVSQIAQRFDQTVQLYNRSGRLGIPTNIGLDPLIGGLLPGNIWIVGAYTGTGKTFFGIQLVLNVLAAGGSAAFFSMEMDKVRIYTRMIGNLAKVSANKLMAGHVDQNVLQAQEKLQSYSKRLFLLDDCYTFEQVSLQCKKMKLMYGLDVVVIDFVQNMRGGGTLYERMSKLAVDLQELAKSLQITLIVLSQISNESQKGLSDSVISYKGAGELAAAADVGLWISKIPLGKDDNGVTTYKENMIRCEIRKCRDGVSARYIDLSINYACGGTISQHAKDMPSQEIEELFDEH